MPIDNLAEFKQLFNAHKKHVFAMALSILRDFEMAEDVLQEVYIKLFQHMKHQRISNVKAWLKLGRILRFHSLSKALIEKELEELGNTKL